MRVELTSSGFAIRCLSHLATRAKLERKERIELSSRVWKTRMFPTTSLPQKLEMNHELELLAGLEPATATFEASHSSSLSYRSRKFWCTVPDSNRCRERGNAAP